MKFRIPELMRSARPLSVALLLAACGGGGGGSPAGEFTNTIGGTVSGLSGAIVLQNNVVDNLPVSSNGNFTFTKSVASGSTYSVNVLAPPTGQTCSVSNGEGKVSSRNVSEVAVVCINAYAVGGAVSGLTGTVVLQDNNGDDLTVATNGVFTFAGKVASGSPYNVTVLTQPIGQTCYVSTGAGTVSSSNVNKVAVVCSNNAIAYTIGGTASGLSGTVVLQDNNGDNLTVSSSGNFTFATSLASGNAYSVTVLTQPTGQICSISTGSGIVSSSNVSNVAVACSNNAYTVGGMVAGLTGTVVLQDNNSDNLTVAANGVFTFATKAASGSPYNVTVLTQPSGQICSVSTGAGTVSNSNISSIAINCATVSQMGGAIQGNALNLVPTVGTLVATGAGAALNNPWGITSDGTNLYVADTGNNMIRKIVIATGVATTLAGTGVAGALDGPGATATFNIPWGITTDGTNVYVADGNNKIRKIVIATGDVSSVTGVANTATVAGAGTFNSPFGITTDGSNLYVADRNNNVIRKIVIATGTVTTFAGTGAAGALDGAGATATFNYPTGITTDGTNLYVTDLFNYKIRKIVIATGVVSSLTGVANVAGVAGASDGPGATAMFIFLSDVTTDGSNLYVADRNNNKIRKIVISTGEVSSLTGVANIIGLVGAVDGAGAAAMFRYPQGITSDGRKLYVTDMAVNNKIRTIQ